MSPLSPAEFREAIREVTEPRYCFKCGAPGIRDLKGVQHEVCAEHLYASVKVVDAMCDVCGSVPCGCDVEPSEDPRDTLDWRER